MLEARGRPVFYISLSFYYESEAHDKIPHALA